MRLLEDLFEHIVGKAAEIDLSRFQVEVFDAVEYVAFVAMDDTNRFGGH